MKRVFIGILLAFVLIGLQAQNTYRHVNNAWSGRNVDKINAVITQVNTLTTPNPPYAYLSVSDSAVAIALTADTWASVTNATSDLFNSTVSNDLTITADSVTVVTPGHYTGTIKVKYSATAADSVGFALFKNMTIATPITLHVSTGTEKVDAILPFFLPSLVAGDDLVLKVINYTNGDDTTIEQCIWNTTFIDE